MLFLGVPMIDTSPSDLRRIGQQQVALARAGEPIQVCLPADFQGQRSNPRSNEIFLFTGFTPLTFDEIAAVEAHLTTLPYPQSLQYGTVILDPDDPLQGTTHEQLDRIERTAGLPQTRFAASGGERGVLERVILIREADYWGDLQANQTEVG